MDGNVWNNCARDDQLALELTQPLAQHTIRDPGNRIAQHAKPQGLPQQQRNDGSAPPAANQLDRLMKTFAEIRSFGHSRMNVCLGARRGTSNLRMNSAEARAYKGGVRTGKFPRQSLS